MSHCYGRLAPKPVALGDLTHYLTEPLPTPPAEVKAPQLVYPMACNDRLGDCLAPGSRVLTADLRWVPVEDVKVGDRLIGFDEHTKPGINRQYRVSVVEKVTRMQKPCYDLDLEDGSTVRASFDHQWLRHGSANDGRGEDFIATEDMRLGQRSSSLCKVLDPWGWEGEDEYTHGYLAGVLDGEGCLATNEHGTVKSVNFTQRDNITLSCVEAGLTALGFEYARQHIASSSLSSRGYEQLRIGNRRQVMRLLGMVRPPRLLQKFKAESLGTLRTEKVKLVGKTDVGVQEVIAIQTSTRTFVAEGFASHNCTIAGVVHTDQATASLVNEPWTYPGDSKVAAQYFQLTNGQDSGLVETDVLRVWSTEGLFGNKLAAFAPLNVKHTQTIKQAVFLTGAVYTGVLVPAPAQAQFQAGAPWDLTGSPEDYQIEGGHAVPAVGYNAMGPVFVTWGALQQATWRWCAAYLEEAYAVVTQEIKERGSLRGVDLAALEADVKALS